MRTRPPSPRILAWCAAMNRSSCSPARTRKSDRSISASRAMSARAALRPSMSGLLQVDLELGSHPLAEEHRVVAFHHPFRATMRDRLDAGVPFHLVKDTVARELEQDQVVEVPSVGD